MLTELGFVSYETTAPALTPNTEYDSFEQAYDWYNAALFCGRLPACLITLQRKRNAYGYFSPERFAARDTDDLTDEIALNPSAFTGRTDAEILSTLVHEMVHLWQQHFGQPGRGRYHNKQWADKMLEIGLHPTDDGTPDGKMTGDHMTHLILPDQPFDVATTELLATGFKLVWQSRDTQPGAGKRKPPAKSKVKYTCGICGVNCWGKPGLRLICLDCLENLMTSGAENPPSPVLTPAE